MTSFPRLVMTSRCSAQPTWMMTSSSRSVMTRRYSAWSTRTMTCPSRSIMTRRCSARSPHGRWCLLQGQSWPNVVLLNLRRRCRHLRELSWSDDVLCVVHVDLNVFFKVNHACDVLLSSRGRWHLLQGQSWLNDVLLSLRGWWLRLRGLLWPYDVMRCPRGR